MDQERSAGRSSGSARFDEALSSLSPDEAAAALDFSAHLVAAAAALGAAVTAETVDQPAVSAVPRTGPEGTSAPGRCVHRAADGQEPSPFGAADRLDGIYPRVQEIHRRYNLAAAIAAPAQIAEAQRVSDGRRKRGEGRLLEGVAFAAKDVYRTSDLATAYGLPGFDHPVDESPIIAALERHGAFLVCKTIANQLGYGALVNPEYGAVLNPRDPRLLTGGSSSGSAAAVAVGLVPFALGTDAGGSCRTPASFCGVVGFKPSRGLLPARGTLALSDRLDTPGLLGRDVRVVHAVLDILAPGADTPGGDRPASGEPRQLRLGFDQDVLTRCGDDVRRSMEQAVRFLGAAGVVVVPVVLGEVLTRARDAGWLELAADATARLWRSVRAEPRAEPVLRMRLAAGTGVTGGDRQLARAGIARCAREHADLMASDGLDGLLLPTSTSTAPQRPSGGSVAQPETFRRAYDATALTIFANVTGAPAVSIPLARPSAADPHIGLQLVGSRGGDHDLLAVAGVIESLLRQTPNYPSGTATASDMSAR